VSAGAVVKGRNAGAAGQGDLEESCTVVWQGWCNARLWAGSVTSDTVDRTDICTDRLNVATGLGDGKCMCGHAAAVARG
jgi:hypothetical protein